MKPMKLLAGLACLAIPALAGAQAMQHQETSGWKELDAFHKVLAANWHPIAKGDFKPARAGSTSLLDAALAWRESTGPKSCDNPKMRDGLTRLISDLGLHADAVKRESSDDAVKGTLKAAHDTFEVFAEACMMGHGPMKKPRLENR